MNLHGRIRPLFASRRHASASRLIFQPGFDQLESRLACAVGYATVNDWGSGLQGQLTLINDSSATLTDWQLSFTYDRAIASIWNAQIVSHVGTQYVIKGFDWNRMIAVGGTQAVGFTAGAGAASPTNFVLTAGAGAPPAPTLPTLSVAGITVSEGPVGATTAARFTVMLSKASTTPVSVNYATAPGTATAGTDYTTTSGSLVFAAGETTKTVTVNVLGDASVEPDETFTLSLTSPTNATLAAATATATITNDDVTPPTPPVSGGTDLWKEQFFAPYVDMGQYPVPDLDGLARRYGVGLLTLGFMQASPSGKLAWAGLDALALDGTHEQAVAIRAEIDALRAAGGDVMVSLGGAAGQSLAQYYAQRNLGTQALAAAYAQAVDTLKLTKLDFDIEGAAVAEPLTLKLQMDAIAIVQQGRPGLGVWLTLPVLPQGLTQDGINVVRAALTAGVTVDGVNVMAMDYGDSAAPPQLKSMGEYAIDAANATFVQMTNLFAGFGKSFGWNQLGVTPMLGLNDVATEVFTLQDADRLETFARSKGLGMLSMWSLNRDNPGPSGQLSNVHCSLPGITAGGFSTTWGDYGSDPVLSGGTPPETALPGITVGDASVSEGNPDASGMATTLVFTVSLSAASTRLVTVQYATADGTAVLGGDYVAAAGVLSFAPGETVKTVTVTVVRDATSEPNETVALSLMGPTNAVLARAFAMGTILDDDTTAPAPTNDVTVTYSQTTAWSTGFNGAIRVKNTGTTAIKGWTIEFDMKATIVNIWNAVIVSHVGTRYVIRNADWNASIAPGAEVSFGFQAEGLAGDVPTNKKFNGRSVK